MALKRIIIIFTFITCGLLLFSVLFSGCASGSRERKVVVYTSVDQQYSEPILKKFEQETGIKVLPVYDVEAAKTTGLVNRVIAEVKQPQADVFWNSEFAQTMLLKEKGVLASYRSPSAQGIPDTFRDAEGYWTGFGGRARILMVNTDLVKQDDYPDSIYELTSEKWAGQEVGIAYPLFGTNATHAAALYAALGQQDGKQFYESLKTKGVQVVDGNSVIRDLVAQGRLKVGLTDTDDAYQAVSEGAPVKIIVPDQKDLGVFIIPNTVAMIDGAPNPEEAKIMIDYLLSTEVENELAASGFIQVPLRSVMVKDEVADWSVVKKMNVDFESVYQNMENVKHELSQIFIR
jgi:iron(III) transport system substrate-binding protein